MSLIIYFSRADENYNVGYIEKGNTEVLAHYIKEYTNSDIYWGGMPEELITALKEVDFNKKIIRPFVTHEGSGLSNIPAQLKSICKGSTIMDAIVIKGSVVNDSKDIIKGWI